MRHALRLARFVAPYRLKIALALLALVVAAGCVLALGQGLKYVVDNGFGSANPQLLNAALGAMIGVAALLSAAPLVRFYLMMMIGAAVMMFVVSWKLAAFVLLGIPATLVPILLLGRRVRRMSRDNQDRVADVSAYVDEAGHESRTVQAYAHQ